MWVHARPVNVIGRRRCLIHDWGFISGAIAEEAYCLLPLVERLVVAGDDEREKECGFG